jgi:hypothetical protein
MGLQSWCSCPASSFTNLLRVWPCREEKAAREIDAELAELLAENEITGSTIRAAISAIANAADPAAMQAELNAGVATFAAAAEVAAAEKVMEEQPALAAGSLTTALTPFAVDDAAGLVQQQQEVQASERISYTRLLLDDDYDLGDDSLDPTKEVTASRPAAISNIGTYTQPFDVHSLVTQGFQPSAV